MQRVEISPQKMGHCVSRDMPYQVTTETNESIFSHHSRVCLDSHGPEGHCYFRVQWIQIQIITKCIPVCLQNTIFSGFKMC